MHEVAPKLKWRGLSPKGILCPSGGKCLASKIAYSIANGHGLYWIETGPTAMITSVFPYLMSSVFSLFGSYTKAAALAMLTFNSLVSALTCTPIFSLARNNV